MVTKRTFFDIYLIDFTYGTYRIKIFVASLKKLNFAV